MALICVATITALTIPGCNDGRATEGERRFVDVTSGQMITADTIGRDPVTRRDRPPVPPRNPSASSDQPASGMQGTPSPGITDGHRRSNQTLPPRFDPATAAAPPASPRGAEPTRIWAIVLDTVTDEDVEFEAEGLLDHRALAERRLDLYRQAAPQLRSAWIHSDDAGSRILIGQFQGLDDPAAQEQLRIVKTIHVDGRYPFLRSILGPVEIGGANAGFDPYDLRELRRRFPKVRPMYTLEIAAWIAEEDDDRSWTECRRHAEAYANQLRASGYEAFFYHSEVQRVSSVTVGKFDLRVVDPQSGLYGPGARRLMSQFPVRLVNGEELLIAQRATGEMKPQEPQMVEVPVNLD